MKKVTIEIANAFVNCTPKKISNSEVIVKEFGQSGVLVSLTLFGNTIAMNDNGVLQITNAGWFSNTTKERLNAIPGVNIYQKNYRWYLNGQEWNGNWIEIK